MTAELELFTYVDQDVRVVIINGEPWFVASDVAKALGYRDSWNLVRRLDEDEKGTHSASTPGGDQNLTVISESGLYVAILGSQIPSAREFKRWITRVVLPQIRKTGSFGVATINMDDPLAELEAATARTQQAIEIAKSERARADKAEQRVEIEQKHRRAIEGGDGILLSDFGKKYFSDVRHTDFFEHLYKKNWLIDQRNTRVRADGQVRDGYDHGKPSFKGRPFIYWHDKGTHAGRRRFQPRVRPQREIDLRDALAAEGLPVNTHSTGLVLISSVELEKLG